MPICNRINKIVVIAESYQVLKEEGYVKSYKKSCSLTLI